MEENSGLSNGYKGRDTALFMIDEITKKINESYNVYATYAELCGGFRIRVNFNNYFIEFYMQLDEILGDWEELENHIMKRIKDKFIEDLLLRKGGNDRDERKRQENRNHQTAI